MTSSEPVGEPISPVWRSGRFLRFWAGNAVSSFGDQISALGLPFIAVTLLDANALLVGLLTAAIWAPNLLALVVGTWVDAVRSRKRVLLVANLLQAAAVASIPAAFFAGALTMPLLYLAALVLGSGGVLYDSAYPSFFVRLVRKNQYLPANSLLSTTGAIASVAGPATGGGLIQVIGAPLALVADAASFLVSAVAIATVRTPSQPSTHANREPYRVRLRLGVAYLRQHPILRASLLGSATMNFAATAVQALLVLYANRQLQLTAGQIGLALGIGALGALIGAATSAALSRRIGGGRAIAAGVALNTLPFIALPIAAVTCFNGFAALAVAEFVSAWAIVLFDVNNNSLRAAVTEDDMRARASGAYATVNYGIRPIGALIAGIAATALGAGAVILGAALLGTLALIFILKSPIAAIQRLEDA